MCICSKLIFRLSVFLLPVMGTDYSYSQKLTFSFDSDSRHKTNTRSVIKSTLRHGSVRVIHDLRQLEDCIFVGDIISSKQIEFWQRKDSCSVRIDDLQKEAALLKANVISINVTEVGCDGVVMSGKAYKCSEQSK